MAEAAGAEATTATARRADASEEAETEAETEGVPEEAETEGVALRERVTATGCTLAGTEGVAGGGKGGLEGRGGDRGGLGGSAGEDGGVGGKATRAQTANCDAGSQCIRDRPCTSIPLAP